MKDNERVNTCHFCRGPVLSDSTGTYCGTYDIDVCDQEDCVSFFVLNIHPFSMKWKKGIQDLVNRNEGRNVNSLKGQAWHLIEIAS